MDLLIRQATINDAEAVSSVLQEAAAWLEQQGMPLWRNNELAVERIAADIETGIFFVAEFADEIVAVTQFQLTDKVVWPDALPDEAAYVHRLAIKRQYARQGISTQLLHWAAARAQKLGRNFLRLDTEFTRLRLRGMYEKFGFEYHSEWHFGPYHVARYQYPLNPKTN